MRYHVVLLKMDPTPKVFVRVGAEVRGPYDVEQLCGLAEAGVVSPTTEAVAMNAVGAAVERAWFTLDVHPAREIIFPARVKLGLKATEFAVVNRPGAEPADPGTPHDVPQMIAEAVVPGRVLRRSHPPELAAHLAGKAAAPQNEVEEMVRAVREREAKFAPPPPPPPKWRPSARLKLVVALAVLGDGVLVAIPTYYNAWDDVWSMVMVRGWFVIYNAALVAVYYVLPKK